MDKTIKYQTAIKEVIQSYVDFFYENSPLQVQTLFDDKNGHYVLIHLGWQEDKWKYSVPLHLDITEGEIWIQRNQTEVDLEEELMELGVSGEDIVLGFYPVETLNVMAQ